MHVKRLFFNQWCFEAGKGNFSKRNKNKTSKTCHSEGSASGRWVHQCRTWMETKDSIFLIIVSLCSIQSKSWETRKLQSWKRASKPNLVNSKFKVNCTYEWKLKYTHSFSKCSEFSSHMNATKHKNFRELFAKCIFYCITFFFSEMNRRYRYWNYRNALWYCMGERQRVSPQD